MGDYTCNYCYKGLPENPPASGNKKYCSKECRREAEVSRRKENIEKRKEKCYGCRRAVDYGYSLCGGGHLYCSRDCFEENH